MIVYDKGDVLSHATTFVVNNEDSKVVVAHICNNIGAWGKGFTAALDKMWSIPRRLYMKNQFKYAGTTFIFPVNKLHTIYVANMIAQKGIRSKTNMRPVQYDWLAECLKSLQYQLTPEYYVFMPKIGTGLGGGDWNTIEKLINEHITNPVFVYTL